MALGQIADILPREKLKLIIPKVKDVDFWYDSLSKFLPKYEINTIYRISAFISQCSHESNGFSVLHENLNYNAVALMKTWPKRFYNIEIAKRYAHKKEDIANYVYANRMGNGNVDSGDGWKYCGKGLIQLTGKDNYNNFSLHSGIELDELPTYLLTHDGAVQSACWYWDSKKLNRLADVKDITAISKVINGGYIGLYDRVEKYNKIIKILSE